MSIKYKEIRLYPSDFSLDVIEASMENHDLAVEFMQYRYGMTEETLGDTRLYDMCTAIEPGKKNKVKNEIRIVVMLNNLNRADILVHELIHALYRLEDIMGLEIHVDSQEWQALMMEYMFKETYTEKGWKEWKPKKSEK